MLALDAAVLTGRCVGLLVELEARRIGRSGRSAGAARVAWCGSSAGPMEARFQRSRRRISIERPSTRSRQRRRHRSGCRHLRRNRARRPARSETRRGAFRPGRRARVREPAAPTAFRCSTCIGCSSIVTSCRRSPSIPGRSDHDARRAEVGLHRHRNTRMCTNSVAKTYKVLRAVMESSARRRPHRAQSVPDQGGGHRAPPQYALRDRR